MTALFSREERCDQCYGNGKVSEQDYIQGEGWIDLPPKTCEACSGTGTALTEVGRELIEFLKEQFDLTPKRR